MKQMYRGFIMETQQMHAEWLAELEQAATARREAAAKQQQADATAKLKEERQQAAEAWMRKFRMAWMNELDQIDRKKEEAAKATLSDQQGEPESKPPTTTTAMAPGKVTKKKGRRISMKAKKSN